MAQGRLDADVPQLAVGQQSETALAPVGAEKASRNSGQPVRERAKDAAPRARSSRGGRNCNVQYHGLALITGDRGAAPECRR